MREPVQSRSQASLARLLDAAEELLGDRGFEDLTLRALCDRAGLSSGAFYARFARKEDLAMPFVRRIDDETTAMVNEWEGSLHGKDFEAASRDLFRRSGALYRRRATLLRALLGVARGNSHVRRTLQEINRVQVGRLTSILARLLERQRDRVGDDSIVLGLLCVLNMLREFALDPVLFDEPYSITENDLLDELTAFFCCRLEVRS